MLDIITVLQEKHLLLKVNNVKVVLKKEQLYSITTDNYGGFLVRITLNRSVTGVKKMYKLRIIE